VDQGSHTILSKPTTFSEAAALRDDLRSYLVVIEHGETIARHAVGPEPLTVGRDLAHSIVISDGKVSRLHLQVALIGNEVVVEDLGSSNGTFLEGRRLSGPTLLSPDQWVQLGNHLLKRCSRTPPRQSPRSGPEGSVAGATNDGSRRAELRLEATREGFAVGFEELRRTLDAFPLDKRARFSAELLFEEVVANVVRHGTMPNRRTTLSLEVALEDDAVRLTFLDDGVPFDPRDRPDPIPAVDLEHAEAGGRGLMLIRSVSRSVEYARTPEGQNRLTVTVSRDAAAGSQMSDSAPPRA
jgi:anti-sigma regulatory factor (Ser/Thr protein kinase)